MNLSVVRKVPLTTALGVQLSVLDLSAYYSICIVTNSTPSVQTVAFRILNHTHQAEIPATSQCQLLIETLRSPYRVPDTIAPDTALTAMATVLSPTPSQTYIGQQAHSYVMAQLGLRGSYVCGVQGAGHTYITDMLQNDLSVHMYSNEPPASTANVSGAIITSHISLTQPSRQRLQSPFSASQVVEAVAEGHMYGYYIVRHPLDVLLSNYAVHLQLDTKRTLSSAAHPDGKDMPSPNLPKPSGIATLKGNWTTLFDDTRFQLTHFMTYPPHGFHTLEQLLYHHSYFSHSDRWRVIPFSNLVEYPVAFLQELFHRAGYILHATTLQPAMLRPAKAPISRWDALTERTRTSVLNTLDKALLAQLVQAGFAI